MTGCYAGNKGELQIVSYALPERLNLEITQFALYRFVLQGHILGQAVFIGRIGLTLDKRVQLFLAGFGYAKAVFGNEIQRHHLFHVRYF